VKAANLALRLLLELAALAAVAVWGAHTGSTTIVRIGLAVAAPLALAVVWGIWVAPRARRRLRDPARMVVELVILALAVAGLAASGYPPLAAGFAIVALANGAYLRASPDDAVPT
jgi:cytochrome b